MASRTTARTRRTETSGYPTEQARMVNGLKVVKDEDVPSNLPVKPGQPRISLKKYRRLTLEDRTQVFGCADCDETGSKWGVQRHRAAVHPKDGDPDTKPDAAEQSELFDPPAPMTKPAAKNGKVDPLAQIRTITLGEVLDLAQDAGKWADVFDNLRREIKQWKDRALAAEATTTKIRAMLGQEQF